jgi:molybdate transport system substrate-binding protein
MAAFFSANTAFVDALREKRLTVDETIGLYAIGRIVLAKPGGSDQRVRTLEDLLDSGVRRVALANPDHAPYGTAGKEALEALAVWDQVRPKLVLGENASQATEFVLSGNADAGIVPLSLAIQAGSRLEYVVIDEELHDPLLQAAAVIQGAPHKELGRAFIDYVNGAGRETMTSYGFLPPDEG